MENTVTTKDHGITSNGFEMLYLGENLVMNCLVWTVLFFSKKIFNCQIRDNEIMKNVFKSDMSWINWLHIIVFVIFVIYLIFRSCFPFGLFFRKLKNRLLGLIEPC